MESIFNYIESKSGLKLTDTEKAIIESKFKVKKLRKRQYFLQEGDICKQMGFIVKGSARMFSIDEKGHEHIVSFGLESWWIGDYESHYLLTPSKYHVEMLEDTELLVVTYGLFYEMVPDIPAIALTLKAVDRQSFISSQKRLHAAISLTAEERYDELLKTYPAFFQRFPQSMIASYLGISPETLSRIRKNAVSK
jgi:CRP-like cAMP-binding protein